MEALMTIPGIGSFIVGCVFLAAAAFSGTRTTKIVLVSLGLVCVALGALLWLQSGH